MQKASQNKGSSKSYTDGKIIDKRDTVERNFIFYVSHIYGITASTIFNTADTIIVGNFVGEALLAAVGACGVLTLVFLALANGFSARACVLIAQLFGAGKEQEMRRQALSSLLVMIGMGLWQQRLVC